MSRFIIPVKDSLGNKVYFQTSNHKGEEAINGYEQVLLWLEKNGFKVVDAPEAPKPQATTSSEMHCLSCGSQMELRSGVSAKSGKPWKGWFCPSPDKHEVIWVK